MFRLDDPPMSVRSLTVGCARIVNLDRRRSVARRHPVQLEVAVASGQRPLEGCERGLVSRAGGRGVLYQLPFTVVKDDTKLGCLDEVILRHDPREGRAHRQLLRLRRNLSP